MATRDPDELMTPSEAARLLGLSADAVRSLGDNGRLPTLRTVGGRRLYRRGDVERLAADRARSEIAAKRATKRSPKARR